MVGQGTRAPICCLWVHTHRSLLCVVLIFPTSVEKRDGNEFFVLLVVSFGITVKSNTVLSSVLRDSVSQDYLIRELNQHCVKQTQRFARYLPLISLCENTHDENTIKGGRRHRHDKRKKFPFRSGGKRLVEVLHQHPEPQLSLVSV